MFEILPNPSLETIMLVGRGAFIFAAFWIFALAFTRWRRLWPLVLAHAIEDFGAFALLAVLHPN